MSGGDLNSTVSHMDAAWFYIASWGSAGGEEEGEGNVVVVMLR